MMIRHVTIQSFGEISFYDAVFNPGLNCIDSRHAPEIPAVIELLLCSRHPRSLPRGWVRPNTCITAEILLGGEEYTLDAVCHQGKLTFAVRDSQGNDATSFYRYTLSHCPEQDAVESFDGQDRTYPTRLLSYRNRADYDTTATLSRRTKRFADTKVFRSYVNQYIRSFRPESIRNGKKYQITITPQGKFEVFSPNTPEKLFLSTTEEKLFLYLCFLNVAEFWEEFEKIRDLHHEKKPLTIQNFLEFLDDAADIRGLMERTAKLQRQTLIFTSNLSEEMQNALNQQRNNIRKDDCNGLLFKS